MRGVKAPPQKPVKLPANLEHGKSRAYQYYKCRCEKCQNWRRSYDRNYAEKRKITPLPLGRRLAGTRGTWYVCVEDGERFRNHDYLVRQCMRCDAKQDIEEHWEREWARKRSRVRPSSGQPLRSTSRKPS